MRPPVSLACLAIVAVAAFPELVLAQAGDPVVGTWELNLAKSRFSSVPPPKSETRTYAMDGKRLKMTSTIVDATGKTSKVESTYTLDDKVYPVTGEPGVDSQALKQIDRFTAEARIMNQGTVVQTGKRTVSNDGKTLTIWFKGSNPKGEKIDNMLVFDRKR